MTIAQEEIFGPVLAVIPYDTEDDAVRIANDSAYGLAGSVYTTDNDKAMKIASQIRTGTYAVNMYAFDPGAPFGGYKNSGIGRENGPEGIEQYSEPRASCCRSVTRPRLSRHQKASSRMSMTARSMPSMTLRSEDSRGNTFFAKNFAATIFPR